MGNELSTEQKAQKKQTVVGNIYNTMEKECFLPDIGIDMALWKYSGLDSAANLQEEYAKKSKAGKLKAADMVKNWGRRLAPLTPFPLAVGLGALVVAMGIERNSAGDEEEEEEDESPMRLLQRVFAEEKEKEVQDLMEEYLKRHQMHLFDEQKLQGELQHWEKLLSAQLTRLKTSMLRDGHMSTRTLKIWVNGAAFHTQMLIHLARLERSDPTPARKAIGAYQEALQDLLRKYKEFKATTIKIDNSPLALARYCKRDDQCSYVDAAMANMKVVQYAVCAQMENTEKPYRIMDKELNKTIKTFTNVPLPSDISLSQIVDAFLDHMLSQYSPITGMHKYFSDAEENLEKLIAQRGEFIISLTSDTTDSLQTQGQELVQAEPNSSMFRSIANWLWFHE